MPPRTPRASADTPRNFKCVNHHDGTFTTTWSDAQGGHKVTAGDAETHVLTQRLVKLILADGPFANA